MTAPRPAEIGVTPSTGFIPAVIKKVTGDERAAHAFIATGVGDEIIEAEPSGAKRGHASEYKTVYWLTALTDGMTDEQRQQAVAWAVDHIGTPYSFIDDAYIGFARLFHWAPKWMRRWLASDQTLECAQLDVAALRAGGNDLFPGKPAGAEAPSDLDRLNLKRLKAKAKP